MLDGLVYTHWWFLSQHQWRKKKSYNWPQASAVTEEETELKQLKDVLGTQGTLRPIFEDRLRQKRSIRERAMALRKLVAESGLDYNAVSELCKPGANVKLFLRLPTLQQILEPDPCQFFSQASRKYLWTRCRFVELPLSCRKRSEQICNNCFHELCYATWV